MKDIAKYYQIIICNRDGYIWVVIAAAAASAFITVGTGTGYCNGHCCTFTGVAAIGAVPCRDRSISGSRGGQYRSFSIAFDPVVPTVGVSVSPLQKTNNNLTLSGSENIYIENVIIGLKVFVRNII